MIGTNIEDWPIMHFNSREKCVKKSNQGTLSEVRARYVLAHRILTHSQFLRQGHFLFINIATLLSRIGAHAPLSGIIEFSNFCRILDI